MANVANGEDHDEPMKQWIQWGTPFSDGYPILVVKYPMKCPYRIAHRMVGLNI